eukprot:6198737-Pleurochrysis_carterae.AAC.1
MKVAVYPVMPSSFVWIYVSQFQPTFTATREQFELLFEVLDLDGSGLLEIVHLHQRISALKQVTIWMNGHIAGYAIYIDDTAGEGAVLHAESCAHD